ncbi:MAG: GNAT family N-acetyltransferase [Bacteroidetes bacterium]|nr:GNAT family N-acetyltransferase [Bacteroidota bacterium]
MLKNLKTKRSSFNEKSKTIIRDGFKNHTAEVVGEKIMKSFSGTEYELYGFYDDNEKLVGGIVYRNLWGALDIKYIYLDKKLRGLKLGKQLIEKALEIGKKELNCNVAYLSTFSFQALGFYEKLGFKVEFTRDKFANNIKEHYLVKML